MNRIDIPDNTESIHSIGAYVMSYEVYQNAFLNALVNRIGRVIVTSKMWNNPWAVFKKGYMEFGETVEEIFVNIAKPHSYDPAVAESEVYKREIPDVRAAFHTMNFQKFYKVTISNDQLRQAFLSWDGITDLIARIVDSLYTAMRYDEYVTMKYMLCREALNGGIFPVKTAPIEGQNADPDEAVINMRTYANNMTFLTSMYNRAGVMNATPVEEQVIIISNATEARIGVKVLAAAFNMSEVDYLGTRVQIDSFSEHDRTRLEELFGDDEGYEWFTGPEILALQSILAMVLDRDWWMVFDNFETFTQNYNGQGLYWQYFYHTWKTFSASPFANAIAYTTQQSEVTAVVVSPAAANVAQGSDIVMSAMVTGTGLVDKAVTWSISGQKSTGTAINPMSGRLHVAREEAADTEITVTATAHDAQTGTGKVTVVAG